jgi:hypothetical protein
MIRAPWFALGLAFGLPLAACGKQNDAPAAVDVPAPPNVSTPRDIGTKIGNGRALEAGTVDISTATRWTRVVPLEGSKAALGGGVEGTATAMTTVDGGRSFKAHSTPVTGEPTWSVGGDGSLVLAVAKRRIPKRALAKGAIAPIDSLTLQFAPLGEKLSAPVALLAPDPTEKSPTIPRGTGMAAVLGPRLASVVVELRPKAFAVAFAAAPGEALPSPIELPASELPVHAAYGRAPRLLTSDGKRLMHRPWPKPGEALASPAVVERAPATPALLDELSLGPECESQGRSYRRFQDASGRPFVLAVGSDDARTLELPATSIATSPIGCGPERVVVEARDPEGLPALVVCTLAEGCSAPQNRPFLRPWAEPHERSLAITTSGSAVIAAQLLRTKSKWGLYVGSSKDGGKLYDLERAVGYEEGNVVDGYELGTVVGLQDRTLLLMSAKILRTTRRSWYVLSTSDGGALWSPP